MCILKKINNIANSTKGMKQMDWILEVNSVINELVWGWPMLILIVGTGIFFTILTRFISVRKFGYIMKNTLLKMFSKEDTGEGEVTAFQAVSTALAATVGTGNIAGVATAITMGGPGALFWMWVSAFFGMTTKFSEVVLSIRYREKTEDGRFVGGPMYYIQNGLNMKWLAVLFAIFGALAAFGIGNMTQSNSVADVMNTTFNINPLVTGIVIAVLVGIVTLGGIKTIGKVTEYLVPVMAIIYIVGGLIIILVNINLIPQALQLVFTEAFTGSAATGATLGMAVQYGVARGVFTNEAGLGSAPIAHAAATTDHPVRQGIWGVFEVFADTIILASITGLIIIMSGMVGGTELDGASLTTAAFDAVLPFGGYIVTFGLLLFAFSTILGWSYYGERCVEFLFNSKKATIIYRLIFIPLIVVGAVGGLTEIWDLADTLNGLMAIPNLIGILILSPVVLKLTKEFFGQDGILEREQEEETKNKEK